MRDPDHTDVRTAPPAIGMLWFRRALIGSGIAVLANVMLALIYRQVTGESLHGVIPITQATPALAIWQIALASAASPLIALTIASILTRVSHEPRRWFIGGGAIIGLLAVIDPLSVPSPGPGNVVVAIIHLVTVLASVMPMIDLVPKLVTSEPRTAPWHEAPAD